MWTIDEGTVNLVEGTATYALPADTIDLLEHVIRIIAVMCLLSLILISPE